MSDLLPWMAPWSGRVLALAIAALAFWLARRGPFGDRSRGRPRCPKCWYDLTGLPPPPNLRCPECGHVLRHDADRFRTRRGHRLTFVAFLLAAALPAFVVVRRVRQFGWEYYLAYGPLYYLFPTTGVDVARIGAYTIREEHDRRLYSDEQTIVRVKRGYSTVFVEKGFRWSVGYAPYQGTSVPPGTDLNGNGIPDVVLEEWSGGAHCCYTLVILELSPAGLKVLAWIDTVNGHAEFKDIDRDGKQEITFPDWTFDYWKTSHAGSPAPRVVLSWREDHGTFAAAPQLMRAPAIAPEELAARVRSLQPELEVVERTAADRPADVAFNSELWATMLDLIYTGHSELAYDFFDAAWPGDGPAKRDFLADFRRQLATSPYADAVVALGHPALRRRP